MTGPDTSSGGGPLHGVVVVEMAGIGPGPLAAMVLADLGARVVRVERPVALTTALPADYALVRGRESVVIDAKTEAGRSLVLQLLASADVLIEGFRPGVMERLGLGPDDCRHVNPGLVYGRATGWGQTGPRSPRAGHDINYISVTGVLDAIGPAGSAPVPPLNLVGDYGGGAMLLLVGVLAALREQERTGQGQVVDAAMVDGVALLASTFHGLVQAGRWSPTRGGNDIDGGAPYYACYRTRDDRYLAVGAIEPRFYSELLAVLELDPDEAAWQSDRSRWPQIRQRFAETFASRDLADWLERAEGRDACLTPVLSFDEAAHDVHARGRDAYQESGRVLVPAPAPRLSRTPLRAGAAPPQIGEHTYLVLSRLGVAAADLARWAEDDVIAGPEK